MKAAFQLLLLALCLLYTYGYLFPRVVLRETQLRGPTQCGNQRSKATVVNALENLDGADNESVDPMIETDGFQLPLVSRMRRKVNALFQLKDPGALILIRHGESALNYNKTFTGWIDADLSDRGVDEMFYAARLLLERGYTIDATYTSRLKRAIRSAWIMYSELGCVYRPVYKSWRLNERMYGALEGTSKPDAVEVMGEEVVQSFRTGLKARPPPMQPGHPHYHGTERKYMDLNPLDIPLTESLQDTMDRTLPLWESRIRPDLLAGRTVMVVAHANSIRGIIKHIDGLSEDGIKKVGIPNGIPLVYKFDKFLKPIPQDNAVLPLRGEFLEKAGLLREALEREKKIKENVLGTFDRSAGADVSARVRRLQLLDDQRKKFWPPSRHGAGAGIGGSRISAGQQGSDKSNKAFTGAIDDERPDGVRLSTPFISTVNDALAGAYYRGGGDTDITLKEAKRGQTGAMNDSNEGRKNERERNFAETMILRDKEGKDEKISGRVVSAAKKFKRSADLEDSFIVMIRHGRTEYNKLGIFTGWEDAPLAREGRAEARAAGKLLKLHGIQFDIVYTSWLSRAIETAWLVLDELDCLWLPIVKTWRLNERMYGALTGLSKKMIAQKHGEQQFKKWRRGYYQRPPAVSSFSSNYPGNDDRYVRYATDVRFSIFESIIRTLSHKRIEMHRKFPKTESLQDCMRRTIPFFTGTIMPESVQKGKTVLIASSENAIRGLLMHLCGIPEDRISEVEIPTGLPMVYSFRNRKIRLLEDGTEDPNNPLGDYNFGAAPELLFNSCPEDEEESPETDQCFFFPDGRSYAYDPLLRLNLALTEEDLQELRRSDSESPTKARDAPEEPQKGVDQEDGSGI